MNNVELVTATPNAEKTMAYIARVSNPKNQENQNFSKLIEYCINHEHWSVFEQAYMTLQIETNRGIAAQILRHRSFTFQEFSQRYADSTQLGNIPVPEVTLLLPPVFNDAYLFLSPAIRVPEVGWMKGTGVTKL